MSVTRERRRALAAGAALLGVFPFAYVAAPWIEATTLVLCPFRAVTGRPCVFCGLTRALAHAVHGEFAAAAALHPLWWVAAALVLAAGLVLLTRALRPGAGVARLALWRPADSWLVVGLVVAGSVLRAVTG